MIKSISKLIDTNAEWNNGTLTDVVAVNDSLELENNYAKNLHAESMGSAPSTFINTEESYWAKKIIHDGDESSSSFNTIAIDCQPNATYTFSIFVRLESGSLVSNSVQIYLRDNDGMDIAESYYIDNEITSEWKLFEVTATTNSNATQLTRASLFVSTTVTNADIRIKDWQLEEGNNATSFVLPEKNIGISNQGSYHSNSSFLAFDVYKKMRLESAIIDANFTGDVVFELQTRDGTQTLKQKTFNITTIGEQRIYFDWEIREGSYNIGRYDNAANTPLKRLANTAIFPYNDEYGVLSIIGSSAAGYYYYLFDWNIFCGNEPTGNRLSLTINLSPIGNVESSIISWTETLNGEAIAIETSIDGQITWQTPTNGNSIPNLTDSSPTLDIRQTLSTADTTITPRLLDLYWEVISSDTDITIINCEITSSRSSPIFKEGIDSIIKVKFLPAKWRKAIEVIRQWQTEVKPTNSWQTEAKPNNTWEV